MHVFLLFLPLLTINLISPAPLVNMTSPQPASADIDMPTSKHCRFLSDPNVLKSEESLLLQHWIEAQRDIFSAPVLPPSPPLLEFREAISRSVNTNPTALLANQRSQVSGGDATNIQLVLEQQAGTIRKINCLEALLLDIQIKRSAEKNRHMFSEPTEFLSYILTRGNELKIYYYTTDQAGVRGLAVFDSLLKVDMAAGWTVAGSIHNHTFFPESEHVFGGVVPSMTDIEYFRNAAREFGIPGASITNGFHTLSVSEDEFWKFSSLRSDE